MAVKFLKPLADASQFPAPSVTATPKFRLRDLDLAQHAKGDVRETIFTRNGRGAIGIAGTALRKENCKNVILIPAYHCPALVEPFIWLDYEIRFYPVKADLTVDISLLEKAISAGDVTHCVVVRYFGFGQNNNDVIRFLHKQPVEIIEDCAHSLFRFVDHFADSGKQVPDVSASICSINKILPTIDGGALYLKSKYEAKLTHVGWLEEAKACAFIVGIPQFVGRLKARFKKSKNETAEVCAEPSEEDSHLRYFQPIDLVSASYRNTKSIFCHSNLKLIRKKRRRNFEYIVNNINNPKVGAPLFNCLKDEDIPYVIPFLLTDECYFYQIRKKGIQILRWEEVAVSDCSVSQEYRSRLIQIPCHQQLSTNQLNFIVDTFNQLRP
ncbi:DegT/DnrJ/EryC1/StrS family aminotransferase [Aliiglaciecola sp. 2_MG-2023]|uniref:DegT/DnrJ/EryC1/StrS family aminotransferase n=1 Tax=unclassified Aliiglaciecola TaxID=2593648 RepID=UPI0026E15A00|nr:MULTISPECIES: DegT/DnrJ/EryC1/StrS family aminotransferase [unclassified Aliiglaciecola]MDO6709199.1 DegT/DnrJ/EryC1/StrS family aminotransferase [Aliiglaciecola sp. 2_MG-2023]MDO6750347.1 DegT/DnrJ/EryC1/StrS family aminotransferase [Aliiglaciecola sp. 1_MG-2023]